MPIHVTEKNWILETAKTAYAFGLNANGMLVHRYWGPKLVRLEDYPPAMNSEGWASINGEGEVVPEEFPGHAGAKYIDPCLKVSFADGVRDVVLTFDSSELVQIASTKWTLNITAPAIRPIALRTMNVT